MNGLHSDENIIQELITERDECLPSILSSLNNEDQGSKLLESIQIIVKFLPTYKITEVNGEVLQYVMPVLKKCVQKAFEDNCLLSDSVDGDFISNILKTNLQVALDVLQATKTVLSFILENDEANLCDIDSVPENVAQIIWNAFEHCKNSSDGYKKTFNVEVLEVFNATQECHLMFLRLFESCIVIQEFEEELKILSHVLDTLCNISEILLDMNVKSMSDTWKGFTAIIQKFSHTLNNTINLNVPVRCLTSEIVRTLNSIDNLGQTEIKEVCQIIKISTFLTKVALKILDIFWNNLDSIAEELLNFCCSIYSFPVDRFRVQAYPDEILQFLDQLFSSMEPFIYRLSNDEQLVKILNPDNFNKLNHPFGLVYLLNNVLKYAFNTEQSGSSIRIDLILNTIFISLNSCYMDIFWMSENSFDNLVLSIAATILTFPNFYGENEYILYQYLLQENVWPALVAMEVWCLVLCNLNSQLSYETLMNIVKDCDNLDFGIYTNRLEKMYLKCFVQRIFQSLPTRMKNEVVQQIGPVKNTASWKIIGLQNFPIEQKFHIENICMTVVEKTESMERGNYYEQDLIYVAENLELLSSINFNEMGLNFKRLVDTIHCLWQYNTNCDITLNKVFKYLLNKLYKITRTLICKFSNRQLLTILNQLNVLIHDKSNELLTCDLLVALSERNTNIGQDESKILQLMVNLISTLLSTQNNVIMQNILEIITRFAINGKYDIVKCIMENSKEFQSEIECYLKKIKMEHTFDKYYLNLLGSFKFKHQCLIWRIDAMPPVIKKIKTDESRNLNNDRKCYETKVLQPVCPPKETNITQIEEDKTDNFTEVIGNLKGEVKSLLKIMKTEKPSRKNVTDIKLIANQLLSLL